MSKIRIGKTDLTAERMGFGALPIQRIPKSDAVALLRRAAAGGINFFDTARNYTDSEEKVGDAFEGTRNNVIIATKTGAQTGEDLKKDLEKSLSLLKTDHIDIYQFHNPPFCPRPGDESGLYDAALDAKKRGLIRYIGITNHRIAIAEEAIESGLYSTLQFPFSYLSTDRETALASSCEAHGMGFIAMKALSGGLITDSAAACAWILRHGNVIPIWGIQREHELDEFLSYINNPPELNDKLAYVIEKDRDELKGDFCRGCGYCMPCPQGIPISTCARASLLLRRAPTSIILSEEGRKMMETVPSCIGCGKCKAKCPYGLDTPALLKKNYEDYRTFLK